MPWTSYSPSKAVKKSAVPGFVALVATPCV